MAYYPGSSFIGVAINWPTPDLYLTTFVQLAFIFFFGAVIFYLPAVLLTPHYPNVYAWTYLAFAALLAGYIWLSFNGPDFTSPQGMLIQATGQKVIVYAAILTMFVQAFGAWQLLRSENG